jgi:alpha-mannosidase
MIQQLQTTEDFGGEETEANFIKGSAELQKSSPKKSLEAFKTSRDSQKTVTRGLACQGY